MQVIQSLWEISSEMKPPLRPIQDRAQSLPDINHDACTHCTLDQAPKPPTVREFAQAGCRPALTFSPVFPFKPWSVTADTVTCTV